MEEHGTDGKKSGGLTVSGEEAGLKVIGLLERHFGLPAGAGCSPSPGWRKAIRCGFLPSRRPWPGNPERRRLRFRICRNSPSSERRTALWPSSSRPDCPRSPERDMRIPRRSASGPCPGIPLFPSLRRTGSTGTRRESCSAAGLSRPSRGPRNSSAIMTGSARNTSPGLRGNGRTEASTCSGTTSQSALWAATRK